MPIYRYATGRFGSRATEAATHRDVAVRLLRANTHPDQTTLCDFRIAKGPAFRAAFTRVLELAHHVRVSDAPNDKQESPTDVAAIHPVVAAEVKAVLVDSGLYSEAAVATVEARPDGTPTGLTVYAAMEKPSRHKTIADLLPQPEPPPGPDTTARNGWRSACRRSWAKCFLGYTNRRSSRCLESAKK